MNCKQCDGVITRKGNKFCSNNCFSKYRNLDLKTKGEVFKGRYWSNSRSVISRHARKVLKDKSIIKRCNICGYNKYVETCHIKSVSNFSDNTLIKDINNINNLIYLCRNCHWEFDNGYIHL